MTSIRQGVRKRRRVLVAVVMILTILGGACGLLDWWGKEGVRERTGYLASVGGTKAEYEAVNAFIAATFPVGMTREEVLAVLDDRFVYKIYPMIDRVSDGAQYVEDQVAFPGLDCVDRDAWREGIGGPGCRGVEYDLVYVNDRLERVTPVVS